MILRLHKKDKAIIKNILIWFLALQPFFDLYMSYFDAKILVLGVSVATLLRLSVVFVLLTLTLISERKRKATIAFLIYTALIAVYTILHHYNAIGFTVPLPFASYSLTNELFYLVRMFVPVSVIYLVYMVRMRYGDVKKIVLVSSLTFSVVICLSNFLKIGYVAYSTDKSIITDSMLSWFYTGATDIPWWELSCRGLFQHTNQLSGVLLILLPLLCHIALKEKKWYYWIVVFLHLVAMINLSTRIATLGGFAVLIGMLILYGAEALLHRNNRKSKLSTASVIACALCVVFTAVVLLKSPFMNRFEDGSILSDILNTENFQNNDVEYDNDKTSKETIVMYLEEVLPQMGIQDMYWKESYPYTEDPSFWYHLIHDVPVSEWSGNRNIRSLLIERILERDNRLSNKFLGISHTRSSSFVWPERDIETHLDSLGIAGTILFIGPYFMALLYGIFSFFKKFLDNLHVEKCCVLFAVALGLATSYLSGHIMNEILPSLYLALVCGVLWSASYDK